MPHSIRRAHRRPLAPLVLLALTSCDSGINLRAGETLHPTPENAPSGNAALITTGSEPPGLSTEALARWREARDLLLGAPVALALGTSSEEGPELFGRIGDAAFDLDGNLVVLDPLGYEVRTFAPDGQHLGSFGQEGEGPMDFASEPQSLEVLPDGSLLVGMRPAMKSFALVAGAYEYRDLIPVFARDMCVTTAGRLFITVHDSQDTDRVLHEVDQAGDSVTLSFGHGYLDEDWLVRNQLSDGTIGCMDEPMQVLFAFDEHPILRAHRPGDDDPVWSAALADYVQPHYAASASSVRMAGAHGEVTDKPHVLGGRHIVWQTYYRRMFSERIRTYLIDAATGRGALISEDFPRVMRVAPRRIVVAWNDPYPRIEVRDLVPPA